MWLILLTSNYWYWLICASPWRPVKPMFGEQIDLVGGMNDSFIPNWTKSTEHDEVKDAIDTLDSKDAFNVTQIPFNSIDRDREPLDEVERIEPRQWPARPDILYTRGAFPTTTEIPLPRNPFNPPTLAQRDPSTQRYLRCTC